MKAIAILVVTIASGLATTVTCHAQVETPTPFHLARARGVFVDSKGHPIAGAAVTLDRDSKVVGSTMTDRAGDFEIKHVTGHFVLHVKKQGYSVLNREIIVGEAATYLFGEKLYVIAGPGACSDDCSQVFTSKSKFDKAISRNIGHQD